MIQERFERWNWELDRGENPLLPDAPLPPSHAIAYYDYKGRLFRVVERVKEAAARCDGDPSALGTYVYDYYCDNDGRVLQKRSLGERGEVSLIIDFEYGGHGGALTETAWSPLDGACRSRKRRGEASR